MYVSLTLRTGHGLLVTVVVIEFVVEIGLAAVVVSVVVVVAESVVEIGLVDVVVFSAVVVVDSIVDVVAVVDVFDTLV